MSGPPKNSFSHNEYPIRLSPCAAASSGGSEKSQTHSVGLGGGTVLPTPDHAGELEAHRL